MEYYKSYNDERNPPNMNPYYNQGMNYGQGNGNDVFGQRTTWILKNAGQLNQQEDPYEQGSFNEFDNDPPLLEELGINFNNIFRRTLNVMNPFMRIDPEIILDADLAGPFIYFIAFGFLLLMAGKLNGFGAIYGVTASATMFLYTILNLMDTPLPLLCALSIIGYSMLPLTFVAFIVALVPTMDHFNSCFIASPFAIWSSITATNMFNSLRPNNSQYFLILYPCGIIYGVYTTMIVFKY